MINEHKNFDPTRCKASVDDGTGWHRNQCQRRPWRDGWCKQHHPDTEAARERQKTAQYEDKLKHDPRTQLCEAREEIARLKAIIAELTDALELACQYLAKAEADELMQNCVHPPRFALNKARIAIAKATGEAVNREVDRETNEVPKYYPNGWPE